MVSTMPAKKNNRRPVGRPKADVETDSVSTRVPLPIKEALEALAKKNYRSVSAEIYMAIEEHLKANGCDVAE